MGQLARSLQMFLLYAFIWLATAATIAAATTGIIFGHFITSY
jgi:hypothetical protein